MMHLTNGGYHSSHKERRISDLANLNINMRAHNMHSTPDDSRSEDSGNNE